MCIFTKTPVFAKFLSQSSKMNVNILYRGEVESNPAFKDVVHWIANQNRSESIECAWVVTVRKKGGTLVGNHHHFPEKEKNTRGPKRECREGESEEIRVGALVVFIVSFPPFLFCFALMWFGFRLSFFGVVSLLRVGCGRLAPSLPRKSYGVKQEMPGRHISWDFTHFLAKNDTRVDIGSSVCNQRPMFLSSKTSMYCNFLCISER